MPTNGDVRSPANGSEHSNAQAAPAVAPFTWKTALGLLAEVLLLFAQWLCIVVESVVRLFVPPAEQNVAGQLVLITGTGHGIGREVALQYGRLGAVVVCVDINDKTNAETVEQIRASGGQAHGFRCDVTDRAAVFALIDRVHQQTGATVSILVNNAGIMPTRPLLKQTEADVRRVFDVNVYANLWLLQATLPDMIRNRRGHVVALSSMAGLVGLENLVPYCGTKFAVKGIMEALSEELRKTFPDIKFTTIYPYMVDTGLCEKPYIRFPSLLPLLKPTDVAASLVQAQRRGLVGCTVPKTLLYAETWTRLYPIRCGQLLADFTQSGVRAVE